MSDPSVVVHVVEPDADARAAVRRLIETLGVEVREHASGEELVASCDGTSLGCVVTEIELPGMCGFRLREVLEAAAPQLPIIMLARNPDVEVAVRALRAGAVDFFEKPFVDREFLRRIRAVVAQVAGDLHT